MSTNKPFKVLIVEDDTAIADMLNSFFVANGATVCYAKDGKEGLAMVESCAPSVVILDVVLPYIDGFSVLETLRETSFHLPVILLTEKKALEEKLRGLDAGADDYVTKPFSPQELLARVHAVLRRYEGDGPASEDKKVEIGELTVDPATREVHLSGCLYLPLTKTEFDLLYYLACRENIAVKRADLLTHVLGYNPDSQTKSLAMHITNIRKKFDLHEVDSIKLLAVPGVGYKFVVTNSAEQNEQE